MSDTISKERYVESSSDDLLPLEPYANREIMCIENYKIWCCIIMIIIALGFLITAASRGCIYNCKN
uniref:Uncharacterized protein n=1 Tax=viral metagenome TaxID=1070528 RepID=A0A6C0AXL8_9ZZZZ|tara:strand:- start:869 stop:1066 length:198 start_codon:yes stop_codon:yes gene_type:complete